MGRYPKIECPASPEHLRELYEVHGLCIREVKEHINNCLQGISRPLSYSLVYKWMRDANVQFRDTSGAKLLEWQRPEGKPRRKRQAETIKKNGAPFIALMVEAGKMYKPHCVCFECGKKFQRAPAHVKRTLAVQGIKWEQGQPVPKKARLYCSRECFKPYNPIIQEMKMMG